MLLIMEELDIDIAVTFAFVLLLRLCKLGAIVDDDKFVVSENRVGDKFNCDGLLLLLLLLSLNKRRFKFFMRTGNKR
jgi:hypothetical protein